MITYNQSGVKQYSMDSIKKIAADLRKNPLSQRELTWESQRLAAIEKEIRRRKRI